MGIGAHLRDSDNDLEGALCLDADVAEDASQQLDMAHDAWHDERHCWDPLRVTQKCVDLTADAVTDRQPWRQPHHLMFVLNLLAPWLPEALFLAQAPNYGRVPGEGLFKGAVKEWRRLAHPQVVGLVEGEELLPEDPEIANGDVRMRVEDARQECVVAEVNGNGAAEERVDNLLRCIARLIHGLPALNYQGELEFREHLDCSIVSAARSRPLCIEDRGRRALVVAIQGDRATTCSNSTAEAKAERLFSEVGEISEDRVS